MNLLFRITYPESYPDVLPEVNLDVEEGDLKDDELSALIAEVKAKVCNLRRWYLCSQHQVLKILTGRRKHRHGNDFYFGISFKGRASSSREAPRGKADRRGEGEGKTSFRGRLFINVPLDIVH